MVSVRANVDCARRPSNECVTHATRTKYLRLRTPVTIGSQFDDWEVCWLGGWTKHRLFYLVMVVRVVERIELVRDYSGQDVSTIIGLD